MARTACPVAANIIAQLEKLTGYTTEAHVIAQRVLQDLENEQLAHRDFQTIGDGIDNVLSSHTFNGRPSTDPVVKELWRINRALNMQWDAFLKGKRSASAAA